MQHKLIYAFAILILLASCTTTKTASTVTQTTPTATTSAPVVSTIILGDWDYTVVGTPDGDFKGVLNVTTSANGYAAKMVSVAGEVPVEKFAFAADKNKATGEVPYNGFMVSLDATLAGDTLKGTMSAGGMDFPFIAFKKK